MKPPWSLGEGLRRLSNLPSVRLVQYSAEGLLNPHRHLPSVPLLLLRSPVALGVRRVVAVPVGRIVHADDSLLTEHLHETRHAVALDLFEDFETQATLDYLHPQRCHPLQPRNIPIA